MIDFVSDDFELYKIITEHILPMFYLYIIRNKLTKETYIGYTNNLSRRFKEHTEKNPELIYYEAYKSRTDARQRESKLKQRGQTVRRLKERLKDSLL